MKKFIIPIAAGAAVLMTLSGCANRDATTEPSEDYPTKSITLVVPYQAGGASDLSARTLAAAMEESLGQSIIVENRTGGAGSVGLSFLSGRPADGYSIGYLPVETVMLQYQGYDLDPAAFDVLGQIVAVPATIAVSADSPYQTLQELLDAAEANPGAITVSNSGAGSIWQAATTALNDAAGVELKAVPFDGGAPAVTAAIGSQVDAVIAGISETSVAASDGRLRVLAILDTVASDALPGVETAQDLGIDVTIGGWGAIGAPAGLPASVRENLAAAVKVAAESDAFRDIINASGNLPVYSAPDEFSSFYNAESERFSNLFAE
ncbi:tripartite tricarboxylate transporter substrate binding protein [Cryobacterium sp. Y62]|uniref:tripartite tricarboxylate transporter substrate binding protein n=1 Tax=Cryobacterium sp. Y62 TaxID=2048284 RepID=UPI000CE2B767|nr:tripartite tricarboxylate transporter substrate binding protein [Cryobacterium sp. Y62]